MARGLYDVDDRRSGRFNMHDVGPEQRRRDFPLKALVLAFLGGTAAILAVGPQLSWVQAASTPSHGGMAISATFNPCGKDKASACVLSGRDFSYADKHYHLADVRVPDGQFPACDAELQLAGRAEKTFMSILNGGSFDMLPDPTDSDPNARILMRDGVSFGQIMIAKGVAQPWAPQPYNWCV